MKGKNGGQDYFLFRRPFIPGNATTFLRRKTAINILLIRRPTVQLDYLRQENLPDIAVSMNEVTIKDKEEFSAKFLVIELVQIQMRQK